MIFCQQRRLLENFRKRRVTLCVSKNWIVPPSVPVYNALFGPHRPRHPLYGLSGVVADPDLNHSPCRARQPPLRARQGGGRAVEVEVGAFRSARPNALGSITRVCVAAFPWPAGLCGAQGPHGKNCKSLVYKPLNVVISRKTRKNLGAQRVKCQNIDPFPNAFPTFPRPFCGT